MKILCEHCQNDITIDVEKAIDSYTVGSIVCSKCLHKQARYISESDLLLYFGISEIFYLFISIITAIIFDRIKTIWIVISIALVLLVLAYVIQRILIRKVYTEAYGKKDYATHEFKEDIRGIQKTLNWQSLLFFALAITFITIDNLKLPFGILSALSVVLTFVKYYLCRKKERSLLNNK